MSLAKQYANALFDVVNKHNELEEALTDLTEVKKVVEEVKGLEEFMINPKISKATKLTTIRDSFKGTNQYVFNMLLVLTEKKQFSIVSDIQKEFTYLYNEHHNQANVIIESVYPLEEEQIAKIGAIFKAKTGYDKLLIENKINESLIGGFRVLVGSKVYDDSVLLQLRKVKDRFKRTKNI